MVWEVAHDAVEDGCFYRTFNWDGGFPRWRLWVQFKDEDEEMPSRISVGFAYAAHGPEPFSMEDELEPALLGHLAELILKAHAKHGPWFPVDGFSEVFGEGSVQGIPPHQEAVGALMGALLESQDPRGTPSFNHQQPVSLPQSHPVEAVQTAAIAAVERTQPGSEAQRLAAQMALRFFPDQETE